MRVYLISYATKEFRKSQEKLVESAIKYGIDKKNIRAFNLTDLKSTKFYTKYSNIFANPRGAGYWLWKPFYIYKTLKDPTISEGDIIIYCDAGSVFINDPLPLIKLCNDKEDILLFKTDELNVKWNKPSCLSKMFKNPLADKILKAKQLAATFQVYKKTSKSLEFVKGWLTYCCKPGLIEDYVKENEIGIKDPRFVEHRHDQAILTNLSIREGIKPYRDPSQGGNHLKHRRWRKKNEWLQMPYKYVNSWEDYVNSDYPTIINHLRNAGGFRLMLINIHTWMPRWMKRIVDKIFRRKKR